MSDKIQTSNKGSEASWCTFKNNVQKEIAQREEKSIINLIFRKKELLLDLISSGIQYKHFWWSDSSELYKIIAKYFDQYKSLLTREQFRSEVENAFKDTDEQTYYRSLYDEIINLDVSVEDFKALKTSLKTRNLLQQSYSVIQNHFSNILEAKGNPRKEIEQFIQDVVAIRSDGEDEYSKTISLSDSLGKVWEQIEDRRVNPESYYGIMSGFKRLDEKMFGFLRGKYLVFTGMPNGGKTSVMFNVSMNMASNKYNVVYVTIESEHMRASQRILSIYSGVDENKILKGGTGEDGLNDSVMSELERAKNELIKMENFSWIQVVQGTPVSKILEMVDRKRSFTKVDVLVVDYLDVVGREKSYPNRPDLELADVSATIQAYGKQHDILIITAQQLKNDMVKKLQKAKDSFNAFDAGVGDVSGSQKIVAAADYVLAVFLDQKTKDRMYIRTTKARFCRSLDVYTLSFDMNSGRISDTLTLENFEEIAKKLENPEMKKLEIKEAEEKTLLSLPEAITENGSASVFGEVGGVDPEDDWLTGQG